MKKIVFVLASILLLGISSCEEESFSRYPSVAIPQFSDEDYFIQLSDKNPEVVYNAAINLGERASGFGRMLSDEKIDKKSSEYIGAKRIYRKIVELLNSHDDSIVAASLRFLQLFSNNYTAKAEILNPVLKIKSNNPQVVYEQIIALEHVANKDSDIADSTLRKFLENPSWIVSRSSYLLIDKLENENLRTELIARYKTVSSETEKLLILNAFKNQPGDNIADFFFNEILTSKSNKIRYALYDILGNCKNQEKVLTWLAQNYGRIILDDQKYLFEHYTATMKEKFSSKLLAIFLNNGFIPRNDFFSLLDEKIDEYSDKDSLKPDDKESLNNLKIVEEAVISGKVMAAYWQSLRREKQALDAKMAGLKAEYDVVAKEAGSRIDEIFRKYGVSEKIRREYRENITISRDTLKSLFAPDEESKNRK